MHKGSAFMCVTFQTFSCLNFLLYDSWWQVPYYWVGIKCYDLVAGDRNVKSSYLLSKSDALERFPMLKGDKLCGAIVYYDGNFLCNNDFEMNHPNPF